ncbi:TonB-linked SusC/RagA family outer membrane protein [Natronoflexus pectinivorans]|uniref:TonB-linked SusC/RagA family outer membrane protein n=2 Tax=Natronoflexus pectinivorans TaxID=682526 RepID=A0A4R2GPH3_9BACT|nr:TonB-linked SusC/RagA family outer membrane protein [Natronoflexus pectinivorans]
MKKKWLTKSSIKSTVLSCMLFMGGLFGLFAQDVTVRGTVTDSFSEPLPGASVLVKGTTQGIVTDINGEFVLNAPVNAILVFSFIGMETVEVEVGGRSVVDVVLHEEYSILEELVVVGYGSVARRDVTTSISSVSTDDLERTPVTNIAQAMQGRAAGVSVIRPSGSPDTDMVVRIRGTTSMNASNDPLYVVDGVPMTDIRFLSANDIESIQILKDASSAAIYGSRAANGVVMITTKSGTAGHSRISFNGHVGVTELTNRIRPLNMSQYREYIDDLGVNITLPDHLTDQTDWYDETYRAGVVQSYQLSASNSVDNLSYYISGGYTRETGVIQVSFFERYNFRANVENQIRPWLNLSTNVAYSDYTGNGIISGQGSNRAGVVLSVVNTPTYAPVWDENNPGQYYNNFYGVNITHPVENMSRSEDNRNNNQRLLATGKTVVSFSDNLNLSSSVTLDRHHNHNTSFLDPIKTSYGRSNYGQASDNRSTGTVMIYDNVLDYNTSRGFHRFDVMAGSSGTTSFWTQSYQSASHFRDGKIQTLNAANRISPGNGTFESDWSIMSYFGRVAYNYDSRYLITANMRADGSSKLHPDHRWGYFPSVSGAWRLSSEPFLADVFWMDDFKIRGGWGQTGNQSGLGDYAYLERYNIQRQNWWEPGNANALIMLNQANLRATDLKWETTTQTNIGIDLTVLNNRITMAMDWYYKLTTDMLMHVTLPSGSAAANSIQRNEGEMVNKGFEFMIDSRNIRNRQLTWDTNFNISFNRNELKSLELTKVYYHANTSDHVNQYIVRNEPGRPLGGFYGYVSDGVDPETGDLIYRDFDDKGFVSTSDRRYIGDPNPDFIFGLRNSFSYRGFSLNVLIQGSYGNDIFNASRIETEGMYDAKNQSRAVLDRWRIPGQITDMPRAGFEILPSSYFIEDGSYLRVKDVSLSYSINPNVLSRWGIARLEPYVTASNLLTWTNYSGMDPEVNQWGGSGAVQGIDWGTYPQTKSFIFGVNVEF